MIGNTWRTIVIIEGRRIIDVDLNSLTINVLKYSCTHGLAQLEMPPRIYIMFLFKINLQCHTSDDVPPEAEIDGRPLIEDTEKMGRTCIVVCGSGCSKGVRNGDKHTSKTTLQAVEQKWDHLWNGGYDSYIVHLLLNFVGISYVLSIIIGSDLGSDEEAYGLEVGKCAIVKVAILHACWRSTPSYPTTISPKYLCWPQGIHAKYASQ